MESLLFISCCIPDEIEGEITKYCRFSHNIHDAANTFQKSIIHGFVENNTLVKVVSAPSLPAFPIGYKREYIPNLHTMIEGKVPCDILPYRTFMLGKYADIERRLVQYVSNWIKTHSSDELTIVAYNINAAFMSALKKIKVLFPNVQTALIVTDMIEDAMNFKANRNLLKRIQLYLHKRDIVTSYQFIDKYILLSEHMKERLPNCKENYIVVEGIYTPQNITSSNEKQNVIFYSGALDTFVNVPEMLEAFKQLKRKDYRLVICGDGPLASFVENEANNNENIEFLGSIARKDVLEWQCKSSLLINPRQPSEITKYSFPSKTMEYFASGTPVLMYRLQGIPEEYYSCCYTIEDTSVEELKNCMGEILDIGDQERNALGKKAKDFILNNKTSKLQVSKILDFLRL